MPRLLLLSLLLCTACHKDFLRTDEPKYARIATAMQASSREGYLPIEGPRPFEFPLDHGPHKDQHIEWWYFTGHLFDETDQRPFGFQLTFFRTGLQKSNPPRPSPFAANDLWMAHFAISDPQQNRFFAEDRFARDALGLGGATASPFQVWTGPWRAHSKDPSLFPMDLVADAEDFRLNLKLTTDKPLILQGDAGYSRKGKEPGNASHYLQFSRLKAKGEITLKNTPFKVTGTAWMDHEWSTSVLGNDLLGWDWFALQLDDGRELMVYELRQKDSKPSPYRSATLIDQQGTLVRYPPDAFHLEVLSHWQSPHSQITYPSEWRIRIPTANLDFHLRPTLKDQELRLAVVYWEGAALVTDPSTGAAQGRAFVELVGYDAP